MNIALVSCSFVLALSSCASLPFADFLFPPDYTGRGYADNEPPLYFDGVEDGFSTDGFKEESPSPSPAPDTYPARRIPDHADQFLKKYNDGLPQQSNRLY